MVDYDDRCRVCLKLFSKDSVRIDLLDNNSRLSNEFVACYGILEGDHPRYLCATCSDKTTEFFQSKQMYAKSRQTFAELVLSKIPAQIIVQHRYISDNSAVIAMEQDTDGGCPENLLSILNAVGKVNSDANAEAAVLVDDEEEEEDDYPEDLLSSDEYADTHMTVGDKDTTPTQQIDVIDQADQGGGAQSTHFSQSSIDSEDTLSAVDLDISETTAVQKPSSKTTTADGPSRLSTYFPQSSSDSEDTLSADDWDVMEKTGVQKESSKTATGDGTSRRVRLQIPPDLNVIHRAINTKEYIKFPCKLCPKICLTKRTFDGHMRTHQGLDPYQCDREGCHMTFKTVVTLKHHTNRHANSIRFVCKEKDCGRSYANSDTLHRHMWNEHWHDKPPPGHVCELCGKVMTSKSLLEIHRSTHKDKSELPLACDYPKCARRFLFSWQVDDHKKMHTASFKCPHCDAAKATQNLLNKHINLHTKETKYPCKVCEKIFYSEAQRKTHNWKVHQRDRSFRCRFCPCLYKSEHSRNLHEKTHDGKKPQKVQKIHECPECNKKYQQKKSLRIHMKNYHFEASESHESTSKIVTRQSGALDILNVAE